MSNLDKALSALLVVVLAVSSIIMVEFASAQSNPKPSVPEFTLQFLEAGVVADGGYHAPVRTIWVTLKNQAFTDYRNSNGVVAGLFYNYRWKSHDANEWQTYIGDDSFPIDSRYFTITNSSIYPNAKCTVLLVNSQRSTFSAGGQFDVQFKALIGYIVNNNGQPCPTGFAGIAVPGYAFVGEQSDWSPTQTITIHASSTSPTISSTISPNEKSFTVSVPLIAALGIVAVLAVLAGSLLLFRRRRKISKMQTA